MLQSPNELGPRAALLQHYNVVKQHTEQSKSRVSCKGCSHTFAGKTTRMAAHYMQTAGESVSLCKSPPEGATDAATAHFSVLEKKRVTTKKRKVDNDAIDSKQLSIWKMLDGKGHDSANAAFARMVFAHGLSFNIGTSKYLLDVMEEARKNPGWCPQGRIALSTTALDREYDKVNKHTKIQINELASVGRALAQLPRFKNKDWGGAAFLPSAKSMSVASWWQQYGRMDGFDEIAKVAVRCNSKIPASAGSERNWSLFGGTWFHVSRSMLCCLLFSYLVFVSFSFLCLASFLPTRHMLSVCCHKYTKTHETLTNTVLCTLMQTSWEVGTLAWALIRQRSWSSCGPT